jgi:UDP-N-acetylglucosamine 2-epimerase (non-hydrolysing)/GDP/UDP-N,N'-diacetylbacillosamine 2-epimerase (hydrolysing)
VLVEVEMLEARDSAYAMARSTGRGVIGCADAFERLRPELVVVLGDRFEILAAATAAMLMNIPIAHIHGGEITEGATDEYIRHAISKMASLHFVSTEVFRRRLIRMGEPPERVFTVGAPGLDQFRRLALPDGGEVLRELNLDPGKPFLLVTYHPATRSASEPEIAADQLLGALDRVPSHQLVFTKANADPGGRAINALLERHAGRNAGRAVLVDALGTSRYLALLRAAAAIVGNSSSGLIEAPAAGTPTVDIGARQKGRPRAASVVNCDETKDAILRALETVLHSGFRARVGGAEPPYGRPGNAAGTMVSVLLRTDPGLLRTKPFHDQEAE